jgi:CheY-like chemotaxis protein
MTDRLRNERTADDQPICPECARPIRPTQGAILQEGYALHLRCEIQRDAATRSMAPRSERTVLYIEDDEVNRFVVERLLDQRPGIRFLGADRGQRGLDLARQHRPDLILLDIHLPDIEGTDLLPVIRRDGVIGATPVIVISSEDEPVFPAHMLAAGAQAYLLKPLNFEEFLAALDLVLPPGDVADP